MLEESVARVCENESKRVMTISQDRTLELSITLSDVSEKSSLPDFSPTAPLFNATINYDKIEKNNAESAVSSNRMSVKGEEGGSMYVF